MRSFEFHPAASDYDALNALALARAARLAYAPAETVVPTLAEWGFSPSGTLFLDNKGTQGFVSGNEAMILVAFRGTQIMALPDLKTNAKIKLVPGPRGQVHHGFRDALSYVWEELVTKIRALSGQGQTVWLTGHSLGAALATVAIARLKFELDLPAQGFYTFGSPRVGDAEFASAFSEALGSQTFRFRNNNDVVTRVPVPGVVLWRYRHVGTPRYFDAKGRLHTDVGASQAMWDRIAGRLDDLGKPGSDGLKDHAIDRYIELLERNA